MPDIEGIVQACEPGPGGNWNEVNWNQVSWPVPGANGDTYASDGIVSDINGAMSALESGDDVLAATGQVQIAGTLAATETGADVFAATGEAVETGEMHAVEVGDDTLAATGSVIVAGSLVAQETGDDVFVASGEAVETGVMHAVETGTDTFASTGEVGIAGAMAAQETGDDTFVATGSLEGAVQRGGYGKDYKKPKQREFNDEVTARKQLRRVIREAIEPVSESAATVLTAQDDKPGVAVVTTSRAIDIPVPPSFSAAQVARMVAAELERAEVAVRTQRARAALEKMIADEQARIARLRREEEELLLLA